MSAPDRTSEPHRRADRDDDREPSKSGFRRAMEAEEELRQAALEPELPVDDEAAVEDDPDAQEILNDTQTLIAEPSAVDPDQRRGVVLAGGDVDVAWDRVDSGEEAVGGTMPTPDQDVVDDLGRAAGVTYSDTEPLRPEEKEAARDDERWELDPASDESYAARQRAMDTPPRKPRRRRT